MPAFLAIKRFCRTNVYSEVWLRRGDQDRFCLDVSFEAARHNDEAMIAADVNLSIALVLDGPAPDVTVPKVREHLCDSATSESRPETDWEYVIYETEWMTLQLIKGEVKIAPPLAAPPKPSEIGGAKWWLFFCRWSSWNG
jgi:hypothetical protein